MSPFERTPSGEEPDTEDVGKEKGQRSPAMIFILITVFIDVLGIGIIVPILPRLIEDFLGGDVPSASLYVGLISASYATMQFFFAPILGALSDRFGRRPVILASLFALGIDYLIMGFSQTLAWLFVGRLIAGIMGANFATAAAYIADVSTPENRAQNYGLMGVAFGVGFTFGPTLGGLLSINSLRLPFFVAAGLALLNFLYGWFVLPESLAEKHRATFSLARANPLASLQFLRKHALLAGLAVTFFMIAMAQRGLENVWVLYTGYRYGWSALQNGLSLGLVGVMAILVQGLLVRPVVQRLGERKTAVLGLSLGVITFTLYGLASQGWMVLGIIVFGAFGGVAGPAIQGLVAGSVGPSEQGKVQGALTSLRSVTSIFAPLIFTSGLFGYFTSDQAPFELPGAPFLLGALLILGSLLWLTRLFRRVPPQEP